MRTNDHIIFIDSKGVSHNALVKSFRDHRNAEHVLIHDEPLVTLTYNLPTGEPKEVIDVQHIEHPGRQETNPDLPTYALHAWKAEGEDHLEVPPDHPLHDHPYEQQKFDDHGRPIPKTRPIYERHIQRHQAAKAAGGADVVQAWSQSIAIPDSESVRPNAADMVATGLVKPEIQVGHPAHAETVAFQFKCESCGKDVVRVAHHHGDQQWDAPAGDKPWAQHICTQADIDAYRESLKPKKEPEMSDLQKAALEPAGDPPQAEVTDVATALDQAGPAPKEPQPPAEQDQA